LSGGPVNNVLPVSTVVNTISIKTITDSSFVEFQGHTDGSVVSGGLDAMAQLSEVVGPALNPHLNKLLVPVSKINLYI